MPDLSRKASVQPCRAADSEQRSRSSTLWISVLDCMDVLEAAFPDWCDELAQITADPSELTKLGDAALNAPDAFLAGLAAGRLAERLSIRALSGRVSDFVAKGALDAPYALDIARLESADGTWFDECACVEADFGASNESMLLLADSAPHPFLAGRLYGRILECVDCRSFTGRLAI